MKRALRHPFSPTGVWCAVALLCLSLPHEGFSEPAYRKFASAYEKCSFKERELLKHDFVSLFAQNAVFTLHRAPHSRELVLLQARGPESKKYFGTPTTLYAHADQGVQAFVPGQTIRGASLKKPWLVFSYAGDKDAPFDSPLLLVLAKRPSEIVWAEPRKVLARYAEPDSGWVARMPLYGYFKPAQPGRNWLKENGLPEKGPRTTEWRARFPDDVAERCDWWSRVCRAFPIGYRESFSVDRDQDSVATRMDYQWLKVADDWGTEPLPFAAIPPTLAFTQLYPGFPIEFSAPIKDPWYVTTYGPFMGAENVERLEYTVPIGKYVNHVLALEKSDLATDNDRVALKNIERAMERKFSSGNEWKFDHTGVNLVWAFHSDSWYARAIPLVAADLAKRAKKSWQLYLERFAIGPWRSGWTTHRGRWMLAGPGSGAWGGFGDMGKLGSTTLLTVWAYAHFTGDWDLVRRKWDFIKRMWNTDLMSDDWLTFCRHSHAEWGDIGPPSMALARMAWKVGDYDTFLYASFLSARQLAGHFATMHGGKYFRENGPFRSEEKMPATVFPSHQHPGAGWLVNGPGFVPKGQPREEQWENRFVRFACPDLGRFYQDTMNDRMRSYLSNPAVLKAHRLQKAGEQDSHILPSFLRLWGLATRASQDEIAAKAPWQKWREYSAHIASNYAVLLGNRKAHRLTRVVPPGEPTDFITGMERVAPGKDWFGPVDQWWGNYNSAWPGTFFGDKSRTFVFGATHPAAAEEKASYRGEEALHWAGVARWTDYVPRRDMTADQERELKGQFNSKWMVIGPFSCGLDDGIEEAYPPEQGIDLTASITVGRRSDVQEPLRWREAEAKDGVLGSQTFFGGVWRIGYHLQYVFSPDERRAALAIGNNGGCKAWLNDDLVHYRHLRHHGYRVRRRAVTLRKGWNMMLIKTEGRWGKWRTSGQFYAPDGKPFEDLKYSPRPVG